MLQVTILNTTNLVIWHQYSYLKRITFKQTFWTHRLDWSLRVKKKGFWNYANEEVHSTLPTSSELEPHHQILFSVIRMIENRNEKEKLHLHCLFKRLKDFNSMSTPLGLYYANRRELCIFFFISTFIVDVV